METEKDDILERLQDLRLWQEQHQSLNGNSVDDKQQNGAYTEEQLQMLQALGLKNGDWFPNEDLNGSDDDEEDDDTFFDNIEQRINDIRSGNGFANKNKGDSVMGTKNISRPMTSQSLDETPVHGMKNMQYSTTPLKTVDLNQVSTEDDGLQMTESDEGRTRAKRPFLKRGEGLTTRFKVPPETFNLKNLPKYKYANRNSMTLEMKLPNRNNPKNESRRNSMCPRVERCSKSTSRRLTMESKENRQKRPISRSKTAPCVRSLSTKNDSNVQLKRGPTINTSSNHPVGTWASKFDPKNDSSTRVTHYKVVDNSHRGEDLNQRELDELQSFEVNERRTAMESLPMPTLSSQLEMENELSDSDSSMENESRPYNHVEFASHVEGIEPLETDTETVLSATAFDFSKTSTPHDKLGFAQFKAKLLEGSVEPLSIETVQNTQADLDVETIDEHGEMDQTLQEQRRELSNRNSLLQSHLRKLEVEIQTYQRENASLIKMKQEHEMERNQLEQDRDEMEAKLHDERIRMEVYFHDERMKIKEKQDQLDRRLREASKPSRKENDEVGRLKSQVAQMESELKAKEVKHGSAQARLRSQVKQLEKQIQEQKLELDVMKRENKRLESENVRLRRENNSKMLSEINKNIAKLATNPPSSAPASTTRPAVKKEIMNKSAKNTVVAKVVSHFPNKTDNKKLSKSSTSSKKSVIESYTDSEPEHDTSDVDIEDENLNGNPINGHASSYFRTTDNHKKPSPVKRKSIPSPKRPSISDQETTLKPADIRKEIFNQDGSKDIYYPNGNLKKISADGMVIRMLYFNKDIKETNLHDGTIKYYYASNNSWETTYVDGKQVLEFADGQIEERTPDGRLEVHFPNGAKRIVDPVNKDIKECWNYPDGTKVDVYRNDDKILYLPSGQREIHTKDHKRREFPDGSVKILYNDGSQETRYSNGRIRKRDKDGNLTLDTGSSDT